MTSSKSSDAAPARSSSDAALEPYVFRLYVGGSTPASARAVVNARRIFEKHLKGRYRLEILDVADNIVRATLDQVVATPTLVKLAPLPLRRFIGDLSNVERIVDGLYLNTTG
ncbi:MAG: circadian clock KaiB family protein [Caldimonas sp.]